MDTSIKAFDLFWQLYHNNSKFKELIDISFKNNQIRFFNEEELTKIKLQNFFSSNPNITNFEDIFLLGYNIGDCVGTSRQLSYSYNNVDLVSGILPLLKGTKNAEKIGGHAWLETQNKIIDTSLMLVIDIILKDSFGYIEEVRITSNQLKHHEYYQIRKELTNDSYLNYQKK